MDDLLGVEVQHAAGHLPGPAHHLGRQDLGLPLNVFVEGALRAELHDDTVARGFGTHTPGKSDMCVRVWERSCWDTIPFQHFHYSPTLCVHVNTEPLLRDTHLVLTGISRC